MEVVLHRLLKFEDFCYNNQVVGVKYITAWCGNWGSAAKQWAVECWVSEPDNSLGNSFVQNNKISFAN